jgi:SM-20-related protein
LQDKNDQWHIIQPLANRLAIFQSDLLHEVLLSKQQRLSITAWLRSGHSIWHG